MNKLQDATWDRKKKRRLNNFYSQFDGVTRGFVARDASAAALDPTGGRLVSFAAAGETASTPLQNVARWLVSGVVQNFESINPMRPAIGAPTQDWRMAVSRLFDQLLAKAWEETRMPPGISMGAGNLWPCDSKDENSKILIPLSLIHI